jgi:hypothetical protein
VRQCREEQTGKLGETNQKYPHPNFRESGEVHLWNPHQKNLNLERGRTKAIYLVELAEVEMVVGFDSLIVDSEHPKSFDRNQEKKKAGGE